MKKGLKFTLSLCLASVMAFGMIGFDMNAYADEGKKHVTVRVEGTDYTILPERGLDVLESVETIGILKEAGLEVDGSNEYIEAINGDCGSFGWTIYSSNGDGVYGPWKDGDSRVFMAMPMNMVAEAHVEKQNISVDDELIVTIKDGKGNPIKGAIVGYYDEKAYKYGKSFVNTGVEPEMTEFVTDKNGEALVTFENEGIYYITAEKKVGRNYDKLQFRAKAVKVEVQ